MQKTLFVHELTQADAMLATLHKGTQEIKQILIAAGKRLDDAIEQGKEYCPISISPSGSLIEESQMFEKMSILLENSNKWSTLAHDVKTRAKDIHSFEVALQSYDALLLETHLLYNETVLKFEDLKLKIKK